LAAGSAIFMRVNLPISVALVWITNPVTMGPMFYFAYKVGAWALQIPPTEFNFELSMDWLMVGLGAIWQPFLLGCLILGTTCATLGFVAMRILWRLHVFQYIKKRRLRKKQASS